MIGRLTDLHGGVNVSDEFIEATELGSTSESKVSETADWMRTPPKQYGLSMPFHEADHAPGY